MKISKLLLILTIVPAVLFAKIELMSPLPIPSVEIVDIDENECKFECMRLLYEEKLIFSMLAKYTYSSEHKSIVNHYMDILNIKNLPYDNLNKNFGKFKIALLQPKKVIGRYAISTTNAVVAYLLSRGIEFEIEVFNSVDESRESIDKTLEEVVSNGYRNLIAILTDSGAQILADRYDEINIYIPTVHKDEIYTNNEMITFGGIDYKGQIEAISRFANTNVVVFKDDSAISEKISTYSKESGMIPVFEKEISQAESTQFRDIIKNNRSIIESSSVILNTPLVKSSLLMSQFVYYDIKPINILSTQINYNPDLFSLTQERDRDSLLIANSIIDPDSELVEYNQLLDNDLKYNWINYSTSIGVESFFSNIDSEYNVFKEGRRGNQIIYGVEIIKTSKNSFTSY